MPKQPEKIRETTDKKGYQYDFKSLDEFIKEELKQEKDVVEKVNKLHRQVDKKRIKDNLEAQRQAIYKLTTLENTMSQRGLKLTDAQKKTYQLKFEKEQLEAQKKQIAEYYKSFGAEARAEEKRKERELDKEIKVYKEIAEQRAKIVEYELGKKQEITKLEKEIAEKKAKGESTDDLEKQIKELQKQLKKPPDDIKQARKEARSTENKELFGNQFEDAFKAFQEEKDKDLGWGNGEVWGGDLVKAMQGVGKAIQEGLNQINNAISKYAEYQTAINARMQGARGETVEIFGELEDNLRKVSYSPLIKTEELYDNLSALIAEGIASNVEQRAFLQTVKEGIATTFDANNSTLKRIIRLQQYDSTAARLGMEAYLTAYLNELTQNTEYLQNTFDNVAESLLEASALMTTQASTEFEYVIQKWLGTLTSLGLDEGTASGIAQAVGYLGSGNISALSSSDLQNLLVMSSVRSGLSYSDLLTKGLTADTANQIMYNIVTYMAELGSDANNNVVKSQLAQTFGVTISDLVAAKNIVQESATNSTITNLYNNLLTYNDMYDELTSQMQVLRKREGISNILENLFSNYTFSTGMSLASNPITYATWKITDLIQGVTGGINIPYISAMGTGIGLETSVENLIKLTLVGASTLGGIGDIISGFASVGDGSILLSKLGFGADASTNVIARGTGYNTRASGVGTSISTMVGNASGSDYASSALTSAEDAQQEKLDQKKEEKQSIDELNEYMQGTQKELYEDMLKNVKSLDQKIDNGITVKIEDSDITKLTSALRVPQ